MSYTTKILNCLKSEIEDNIYEYLPDVDVLELRKDGCSECEYFHGICKDNKSFYCNIKECITNKCHNEYFQDNKMINLFNGNYKTYKYIEKPIANSFISYLKNNSEMYLLVKEYILQIKDYLSYSSETISKVELAQVLKHKLAEYLLNVTVDENNNYIVEDSLLNKVYSIDI